MPLRIVYEFWLMRINLYLYISPFIVFSIIQCVYIYVYLHIQRYIDTHLHIYTHHYFFQKGN